jgi:hypothetical protein
MKIVTQPKSRKHTSKKHLQKAKLTVRKNRAIHHRVMLHPFTAFVLLCAGVFIVNWTFRAAADSITVTAKVATSPLTQGATITGPLDGSILTTGAVKVFGTCPPNSYVVLHRNSTASGTALCTAGNTYEINTSLFPNANILNIQAYNFTDDPGPTTPEVTVTYTIPAPAQVTPGNTSTPVTIRPRTIPQPINLPIITSQFSYSTFAVNNDFEWPVETSGGSIPYKITSFWGDNTSTDYQTTSEQQLWIKHKYSKPGNYKVNIKLTDANNNESVLQLFAIIRLPAGATTAINSASRNLFSPIGVNGIKTPLQTLLDKHWLQLAWGSYVIVSLMSVSFWLGERQKIANLIKLKGQRHHRA